MSLVLFLICAIRNGTPKRGSVVKPFKPFSSNSSGFAFLYQVSYDSFALLQNDPVSLQFASKYSLQNNVYFESQNSDASIALVPWGGTKGPALDAYNQLVADGVDLSWYYTMFIHPMPPEMIEALRQKDLVIVPELNYMGQYASYLRSEGINATAITQYTGLPFKVRRLVTEIKNLVSNQIKVGV